MRGPALAGVVGLAACAYVYANAGEGESTTDVVFAGHDVVAENGVGAATVGAVVGGHFGGTARFEAGASVLPGFERPREFVF